MCENMCMLLLITIVDLRDYSSQKIKHMLLKYLPSIIHRCRTFNDYYKLSEMIMECSSKDYLLKTMIKWESYSFSAPRTPQQNEVIERKTKP